MSSQSRRTIRDRARLAVDELCHSLGSGPSIASAPAATTVQACRLEERMLMSASPVALVVEPMAEAAASMVAAESADLVTVTDQQAESSEAGIEATEPPADSRLATSVDSAPARSRATTGAELIVIDSRVEDPDTLLAELLNSDRDVLLLRLDATRDGLQQITEKLERSGPVSTIHLLSHGQSGELLLGSTRLNLDSLPQHSAELLAWQHTLTDNADLMIYGCDVAAGPTGREFVSAMAALTGADVASSDDRTGAAELGGDWDLEATVGDIDVPASFMAPSSGLWAHTLDLQPTSDLQINATTFQTQSTDAETRGSQNAVAIDAAGNYVVVWTSKIQDGNNDGVYARLFNADGTARTAEILVNQTTSNDQHWARVASDVAGNFVVTWTSQNQDGSGAGVYLRRFDSAGNALAAESRVNTTTSGDQKNSVIAMCASGEFIVAWQGNGAGDSSGVFYRRFNADGTAVNASEVLANSSTGVAEFDPAVAISSNGTAVVAWEADDHVYYRRITAAGATTGSQTQIDIGVSNCSGLAAAMDDAGNVTFVFREGNVLPGVWGRGFKADDSHNYGWFMIDGGDSDSVSIAMTGNGEFIVTYEKSSDGDAAGIFARKYAADGSSTGAAFSVNQQTTGNQESPSVAAVSATDFVIVWSGEGSADTAGIQARQFANERPTISVIADVLADEDTSVGPINFTINDAETTPDDLVVTVSSDNGTLLPSGSFLLGGTGANRTLTWTPAFNQFGAATVTVQVSDGSKAATTSLAVTVTSVNDAPVLVNNGPDSVPEGGWLTFDSSILLTTDVDDAAGQLTYALAAAPSNGILRRSTTVLTAGMSWTQDDINNGRLTYEHNGSETISDSFSFTVSDASAATIAISSFNLTVAPMNDAPVLAPQAPSLGVVEIGQTTAAVTVATLLGSSVTDADAGALGGLVIHATAGGGTWQHSADGISWTDVGSVSATQALLLPATDRIRYMAGLTAETATLSFRAWDRTGATTGLERTLFDTTSGVGSTSSFSSAVDAASLVVEDNSPIGQADSYTLSEDSSLVVTTPAGWFNSNWKWRRSIVIDNSTGSQDLDDQPVLITFDATTIDYVLTQNAGQDLRFVDAGGAVLNHEIEEWNETGTSRVWVRVPQIESGEIESIFAYYGNAEALDTQNAAGVWNGAEADAVLHLHGVSVDSSSRQTPVTTSGTTSSIGVAAGAHTFDGVDDFVRLDNDPALNNIFAGGGTISAWINPTDWGENGFGRILDKASAPFEGSTLGNGWAFQVTSNGRLSFEHGFTLSTGRWQSASGTIDLNEWTHVAVTYDSSLLFNNAQLYINGVAVATTTETLPLGLANSDSAYQLTIGNRAVATDRTFEGRIDEVRVHSDARSGEHINADFRTIAGTLGTVSTTATPLTGVLQNDRSQFGLPLTASVASGPTNAQSFSLNADGSFTYTPVADFEGTDTFTYRISDGLLTSAQVTVSLVVTGINDAPTLVTVSNSSVRGYTDAAIVGIVTVTDADLSDTHSFVVSDARFEVAGGQLQLRSGQQIDPIAETSINMTLTAVDSGGLSTSTVLAVTVTNPNTTPTLALANRVSTLAENSSTATRVRVADISVSDDGLGTNLLAISGPDATHFEIVGGRLYLKAGTILDYEAQSSYSVTVSVDDATIGATPDDQRTLNLTVTNVNEAPVAFAGTTYSIVEGGSLTVTAAGSSDPDGNALTYAWDIDGDGMFGNGTGQTRTYSWAQLKAMGPAINDDATRTIAVRVTDSVGLSSDASATLIIANTAPTVTITGAVSVDSGTSYTLALSETDPGADTITSWTINWGDGTSETITGNPNSATHLFAAPGLTHVISATVTDEDGTHPLTGSPVTVVVNNTVPSDVELSSDRVAGSVAGAIVGNLTFVDPDFGDTHVWQVSDARFEVVAGQLKLRSTESLNADTEPSVMLTVSVTDSTGAAAASAFTLRVNHSPVATGDSYEINNPGSFSFSNRSAGVLVNDADADGDVLSADLVAGPAHAASFTLNSNGSFSYRPASGFAGNDSFQYRAYDGLSWSDPVTVSLHVNRKATLSFVQLETRVDENSVLSTPLLIGTVAVVDDTEGTNLLTLSGQDVSLFELDGLNQLWLRAGTTLDFESQTQLIVNVNVDDATIVGSPDNVRTVTVDVGNVNETPTATALTGIMLLEDAANGSISTSTAFSDPDGDSLEWSLNVITQSSGLFDSLTINRTTGVVSYNLGTNAFGTASVRITVADPGGLRTSVLQQFNVQSVNDAPVVQAISASTNATSPIVSSVLTGAFDVEGTPLRAVLIAGPANGTLTLNLNGSFVYQANTAFYGTDTFEFAASDGSLTSQTATATILVRPLAVNPGTQQSQGSGAAPAVVAQGSGTPQKSQTTTTANDGGTGTGVLPTGGPGQQQSGNGIVTMSTESSDEDEPAFATGVTLADADSTGHMARTFTMSTGLFLNQNGSGPSNTSRRSTDSTTTTTARTSIITFDSHAHAVQVALERELMYRQLTDANREQAKSFADNLSRNIDFDARVVGSVGVVTTGFSVGYLLWIVRGGMLLSGLLAQLPAWTMVDPLLVVDDKQKDDDKESLQTLMDRQQAELNARKVEPKSGADHPTEVTDQSDTPSTQI